MPSNNFLTAVKKKKKEHFSPFTYITRCFLRKKLKPCGSGDCLMQLSGNTNRFLCGHWLGRRRISIDNLFIVCATHAAASSPLDALLCVHL